MLLYSLKTFGGPAMRDEDWRRNSLVAAAALAVASSAAVGLGSDETSMVGFILVVATGGVLVVAEVPHGKWVAAEVAGLVSVAALQRAVLFVDASRPDWFWAAQWYVIAGAVIAGLRYMKGQRADGLLRLCIAAGALSLTSVGGTIFSGTSSQQLYVLVAHVLLLAAGLLLAERVLVWWGGHCRCAEHHVGVALLCLCDACPRRFGPNCAGGVALEPEAARQYRRTGRGWSSD